MLNRKMVSLMLILVLCITTIMTGCAPSADKDPVAEPDDKEVVGTGDPKEGWPEELVIALIPTEDEDLIKDRWEDFRQYMEKELGIPVELFLGTDYTASIEAMRNGFVHVGYYGPFAFVLAHERAKAEPFCVVLRDVASGVASYQALFLALEDGGYESIKDLEGKSMGWVDPTSTSGHLFPKAYVIEQTGLEYETVDDYFSNVVFTGGHEPSFLAVLNGDIDCAPITSNNYQRYLNAFKDHPNIGKIKVIDKTEPIPTSPFTYHADLPESLKEALTEAFLGVDETPDGDGSIFIPVENSAYDVIRKTVTALGMDPEDLM